MRTTLIFAVLSLALAACGKKPEPPKPGEPQSSPERAETRGIRATESVGYAGNAIAGKVDGALDANDQRKAGLDAAIEAQTASPQ